MTTYVAFLRGVNLGPTRKIGMPELRALAAGLGYERVWTHLNSGNVVLDTDEQPDQVERRLGDAIAAEFGHRVDVTVRSAAELEELLTANPWPDGSPSQVTVAFLVDTPPRDAEQRLAAVATEHEPYVVGEREVWIWFRDGQARSVLARDASVVVGVSATVRTLGGLGRLVAKLTAPSPPPQRDARRS